MINIYGIENDVRRNGKFEVAFKGCNYYAKLVIEPRVPGGEFEVIFDCAGDFIAIAPGR